MRINTHYKITLIFTCITALLLSLGYFYLSDNFKTYTDQNIKTNLRRQIALARFALESSVKNPLDLDAIADRIGRDLKLRATIIALDGRVLGDSELDHEALRQVENHLMRPEIQEAMRNPFGENQRFSTTVNKSMRYTATLFGNAQFEGIIRLAVPLSEIRVISEQFRDTIAISLFGVFILAIFINYFASAFISKPIRTMSKVAKRIAAGDFSKINTFALDGEIKDLGTSFNTMSAQLQSRLQEMELGRSRLEAVLLGMQEGVLVVDAKGSIVLMNQALRDFFHIQKEGTGKNVIEVIRNIEIQTIIDDALKNKHQLEPHQITILSPEEKNLSIFARPILQENQQEGTILVFHDLTNVQRLEKIRQDFVANVSHELKTPIANIKGYAETLLNGALEDKTHAKDFLSIVYNESERLARLVDDLLNLSKIESGKLTMNLKATALAPIIHKVVSSMKIQAERKSITITVKLPGNIAQVMADSTRITQVLFNLIDNAIKYTAQDGHIEISGMEAKNEIQVQVTDNGIGIPAKEIPRLFERFYRVDKGRSRELGGTGLGLSIVKHIVKAHQGEISIKSKLGKGTAFIFTLPKSYAFPHPSQDASE